MARADTPNITPAAICVPPPPAVKISAIEPSPPNAGNTMSQLDAPAEAGSGIDGAGRTSTRRITVFGGSRRGGRLTITTATTSPPSRVSAATNATRGGWCCAGSAEGRDDATLRVGVVGRRVRQSGDDRGEHACEVVRGLLPLPLLHEIGSLCVTAPALHERLQVGCGPGSTGSQPTCSRSCRAGAVTHRLPISCRSGSGSRPRTTSHACSPRSSPDWRTRRPTTPTRSVASSRPSADPAQHHPPRAALVAALTLEGGLVVAVVMFKRPPRREPPKTAMRRVDVRPPPSMPEPASAGASSWLMVVPALGGLGSMALIFTAGGEDQRHRAQPAQRRHHHEPARRARRGRFRHRRRRAHIYSPHHRRRRLAAGWTLDLHNRHNESAFEGQRRDQRDAGWMVLCGVS